MDPQAIDLLEPRPEYEAGYPSLLPEGGQRTVDAAHGRQLRVPVSALAQHVLMLYGEAREAKEHTIEQVIIDAARVRKGEFTQAFLAELADKNIEANYVPILDNKCSVATGIQRKVFFHGGKIAMGIEATPLPDLPQAAMQRAEERAEEYIIRHIEQSGAPASQAQVANIQDWAREIVRRELKRESKQRMGRAFDRMQDVFTEGGYYRAMYDFFDDLPTYPCAFVAGPIPVRRWTRTWTAPDKWEWKQRIVETWRLVHCKFIYPQPGIEGIDDGYVIMRGEMQREEVEALIGVPGVDAQAVRALLARRDSAYEDYEFGLDEVLDRLERKGWIRTRDTGPGKFDSLLFRGRVSGRVLRQSGIANAPAEGDVPCVVKTVGDVVVKCVLDDDPRGRKNLVKASYFNKPHSFWGEGIPEKCKDIERSYHSTLRSMVYNMSIASGPQVAVWRDAIGEEQDIESLYPWRIWEFTGEAGTFRGGQGAGARPIEFYQPDSNAPTLIAVADFYDHLMDKMTGVGSYDTGDTDVHGAGRTYGGTMAIMDAGSTTQRQVTDNVDDGVVTQSAVLLHDYMLRHDMFPPEEVGDLRVRGKGANAIHQEQQNSVRAMEFLQAVGSSPDMLAALGKEKLVGMLRKTAAMVGLDWEDDDTDDVVPSFAEDAAMAGLMPPPGAGMQPAPQGGPPGGSLPAPANGANAGLDAGGNVMGGGDVT